MMETSAEVRGCAHQFVPCFQLKERKQKGFKCRLPCQEICRSCKEKCNAECFECYHNETNLMYLEKATCLRCKMVAPTNPKRERKKKIKVVKLKFKPRFEDN